MIKFEDVEMRIHDANGERWISFGEVNQALGYADRNGIKKIVDRSPREFTGQQTVVTVTTVGKLREVRVLNYRGVLRVCMKSDGPRAARFRDWAIDVLMKVITTGDGVA